MNVCTYVRDDGSPCKAPSKAEGLYCVRHLGGEVQPVRTTPPPPPAQATVKKKGPDPEVVGAAIAQVLLRQESERLAASARDRGRKAQRDHQGLDLPGLPERDEPYRLVPRRTRPDATVILDPDTGQPPKSLRADWVQHWCRTRDHQDRPSEASLSDREDYGFEVVRDDAGRPITGRFGIAVQAPPEQAALRTADATPKGAVKRDDYLDGALEAADTINRKRGEPVARIVQEADHQLQRVMHGSGVGEPEQ